MTQTPSRDWQKDMEMCEAVKDSKWLTLESSATAVWQRGGLMSTIWEGPDAEALQQYKEALPYWLQEAKTLQEIASGRGREALRLSKLLGDLNDDLTATEARADEAEAREQRLKEELEGALRFIGRTEHIPEETVAGFIRAHFSQALSTLYPDTPAPKEGE